MSIEPIVNKSRGNVIGVIALVVASLRMAKLLWDEFHGKQSPVRMKILL